MLGGPSYTCKSMQSGNNLNRIKLQKEEEEEKKLHASHFRFFMGVLQNSRKYAACHSGRFCCRADWRRIFFRDACLWNRHGVGSGVTAGDRWQERLKVGRNCDKSWLIDPKYQKKVTLEQTRVCFFMPENHLRSVKDLLQGIDLLLWWTLGVLHN